MTSTDKKRGIEEIKNDIAKSFKVLEGLSAGSALYDVTLAKTSPSSGALKQLRVAGNGLRTDIAFFKETKTVCREVLQRTKAEYEEWGQDEKGKIVKFIRESYQDKKDLLKHSEITKESLVCALSGLDKDVDGYLEKLNQKLSEIEDKIQEEEGKRAEVRKNILRSKMEVGKNELAKIEEEDRLFEQELEKLDLLESELNLAVTEKENEGQIKEVRSFLNEKIH